jgi:hypothetical protein
VKELAPFSLCKIALQTVELRSGFWPWVLGAIEPAFLVEAS